MSNWNVFKIVLVILSKWLKAGQLDRGRSLQRFETHPRRSSSGRKKRQYVVSQLRRILPERYPTTGKSNGYSNVADYVALYSNRPRPNSLVFNHCANTYIGRVSLWEKLVLVMFKTENLTFALTIFWGGCTLYTETSSQIRWKEWQTKWRQK